jgi:hypothetical protein
MNIPAGFKLGPCEDPALPGAGGMGEVCRARDAKLGRDVRRRCCGRLSPKTLVAWSIAARGEEMPTLLNDPTIASIYGLECAYGRRFMRRSRAWKRGSERSRSKMGST